VLSFLLETSLQVLEAALQVLEGRPIRNKIPKFQYNKKRAYKQIKKLF